MHHELMGLDGACINTCTKPEPVYIPKTIPLAVGCGVGGFVPTMAESLHDALLLD